MPALAAVRAHHSCVGGVCRPATCTVPVVRAPTTLQKKPSAWYSSDYVMTLDGHEGKDDDDSDYVMPLDGDEGEDDSDSDSVMTLDGHEGEDDDEEEASPNKRARATSAPPNSAPSRGRGRRGAKAKASVTAQPRGRLQVRLAQACLRWGVRAVVPGWHWLPAAVAAALTSSSYPLLCGRMCSARRPSPRAVPLRTALPTATLRPRAVPCRRVPLPHRPSQRPCLQHRLLSDVHVLSV